MLAYAISRGISILLWGIARDLSGVMAQPLALTSMRHAPYATSGPLFAHQNVKFGPQTSHNSIY
jgi:hypothetical protein